MATHTPGPWKVDPKNPISILDSSGERYDTLVAQANGKGYDEANANAKLIAAAPDLLEAIRKLTVEATHYRLSSHGTGGAFLEEAIRNAKKAIKKALD